jgi:hypothetical protein
MIAVDVVHVLPRADVVDHEEAEDCACLPDVQPEQCDDGSLGWAVVHHAWDGRS